MIWIVVPYCWSRRTRNAIASNRIFGDLQAHTSVAHAAQRRITGTSRYEIRRFVLDGINFSSDTYFVRYWKMCLPSRAWDREGSYGEVGPRRDDRRRRLREFSIRKGNRNVRGRMKIKVDPIATYGASRRDDTSAPSSSSVRFYPEHRREILSSPT